MEKDKGDKRKRKNTYCININNIHGKIFMVSLICVNCEKEFLVKNHRKNKAKFCSKKCISEYKSVEITCLNCNEKFRIGKSISDRTKFCDRKCREEYHNKRGKVIICKNCEEEKYVPFYRKNISKFCSIKCQKEFYDNSQKLICPVCKQKFVKEKWKITRSKIIYCSQECYFKRSPKIKVKCCGCKKELLIYQSRNRYYNKIYCSNKCRLKYGVIGKLTECNNFSKNYQKFIRSLRHSSLYYEWRKKCLKKDEFKCSLCFSDKKITVHHKNKTMYDFVKQYGFDKDKIIEDKDFFNIDNGMVLCRKCHFNTHKKGTKNERSRNRKN